MANATPHEMRAGFEIYRRSVGDLSREDLNRQLFELGYGPVSVRSYQHFGKLIRAGVDRYIAINRFDLARSSAPYENASANTRYRYVPSHESVAVLFSRGRDLYEVTFVARDIGETGVVLELLDDEFTEGLRTLGPNSGDMVSIRFAESGRIETGRVVELDADRTPVLLELEFDHLLTLPLIELGDQRPPEIVTYVLRAAHEDSTTIDVAGRRVFYYFEFLEGLRSIANLADQTGDGRRYSPPPRLDKLRIASSPQFSVEITELIMRLSPLGLVSAVIAGASLSVSKRKEWFEGSQAREAVRTEQATAIKTISEARKLAAEADLAEIDLERKRAELAYRKSIHASASQFAELASDDSALIDLLIDREVLPPLRRLGESEITALEFGSDEVHDPGS